jgi:hypothetical protein
MARFVIDTGDVEMDRTAELELQTSIQKVVLNHVAESGYEKPWVVKFPRDWYGIILHPDLDPIFDREAGIARGLFGLK